MWAKAIVIVLIFTALTTAQSASPTLSVGSSSDPGRTDGSNMMAPPDADNKGASPGGPFFHYG